MRPLFTDLRKVPALSNREGLPPRVFATCALNNAPARFVTTAPLFMLKVWPADQRMAPAFSSVQELRKTDAAGLGTVRVVPGETITRPLPLILPPFQVESPCSVRVPLTESVD